MDKKRLSTESIEDYKLRICDNKKLLGLSWEGVTELLNKELGLEYKETAYRKWHKLFKEGYTYAVANSTSTSAELEELNEKIKELEFAKMQVQDQKREYKAYLRHEGRLDHLLKTLVASIKEEVNSARPLNYEKADVTFNGDTALTLLLSDLHKGMVTSNHWNTFNEEVFYQRIEQTISETIAYQELTGARELHVMQLGDLIEGNLHRLTKIGETETAIEQTKSVAEALARLTATLANYFEKVVIHSVKGNHDRVSSRKEEEIKTESFHDFVVWYMEARLESMPNVTIMENEYDSEIIVAEILGNTYFGVHGHLDSYPTVIQNLTLMIKKFPTAVFAGHIHKNFENEIHGVDLIVNGGFAGTNGYAKDSRLISKAHQKLLWLDKNGRKATFYIKY
ncbi:hypothetical protein ACIQ1D_19470 [Lysinibacillus xylanilyticus]|uniref:hypothetical protein n=1 Tax=Lysinibacillus xylanilyticus TaxID=582475 RepID=UPI00381A161D